MKLHVSNIHSVHPTNYIVIDLFCNVHRNNLNIVSAT